MEMYKDAMTDAKGIKFDKVNKYNIWLDDALATSDL
jgi:hypothetical protein